MTQFNSNFTGTGPVHVIDTNPTSPTYNTQITTINITPPNPVAPQSYGVAITSDGKQAYVTSCAPPNATVSPCGVVPVSVIDTDPTSPTYNTVIASVPAGVSPIDVAIGAPVYSGGQLAGPKKMDFGNVAVGNSATRRITIANGSTTQALQVNVAAPTPNPPYTLVSGGGTATLGPGQSEQVVVQFTPTAASDTAITGALSIATSDPSTPSASVALTGRGR